MWLIKQIIRHPLCCYHIAALIAVPGLHSILELEGCGRLGDEMKAGKRPEERWARPGDQGGDVGFGKNEVSGARLGVT